MPSGIVLEALPPDQGWASDFHAGRPATMAAVYRDHFGLVRSAVGVVLGGADCETVIHEVFYRLLSSDKLRGSYQGGAFGSWLYAVAKNQAIDYARRRARETPDGLVPMREARAVCIDDQLEARALLLKFQTEVLRPEWRSVFEARFLRQLDQREAARSLGIPRTTLLYREHRIRGLLRSFLLQPEKRHGRP